MKCGLAWRMALGAGPRWIVGGNSPPLSLLEACGQFGIYENELEGLAMRVGKRNASFKTRSGVRSFTAK